MRFRILVSAVALVGIAAAATITVRGSVLASAKVCCAESHECCEGGSGTCCKAASDKQWSVVNFMNTVLVSGALVSGPVLIVHDDQKMARGEPCTTFYRFDPSDGPKEPLVSFHCKPRRAAKVEATTLTTVPTDDSSVKRLIEYQIAGDAEAHGIPR